MVVHRVVVFDLDDTLYLERDYVASGFRSVAEKVGRVIGKTESWFTFLWQDFAAGVRGNSFNRLVDTHPEIRQFFDVEQLVEFYRLHQPNISLSREALTVLDRLRAQGRKLGVITDGNKETQKLKIDALGLRMLVDQVVITGRWGREFWKPHPRPYLEIVHSFGCAPRDCVYIGDNPEKDFIGAKRLGWATVRLRIPGQLRFDAEPPSAEFAPDYEVNSWRELMAVLGC